MKNLKVVFMGTPEFSVNVLEALIKNTNVVGVVTQPDKIVGRKKEIQFSPVKKLSLQNNIKVLQPIKIKEEYQDILDLNPDIIITCAYGQIIPKILLDTPLYKALNVHASLLPKYRGGAPIERAIMNGETDTGVSIMFMAPGMDDGDIITQKSIKIDEKDDAKILREKLSLLGTNLLLESLPSILNKENKRIKQDESLVSFAPVIKREEELIDFNDVCINIYNKIRALHPTPLAYFKINGEEIKVASVSYNICSVKDVGLITKVNKKTGEFVITCLDGEINLLSIKPAGKNVMDVKSYLNGGNKENLIGVYVNE